MIGRRVLVAAAAAVLVSGCDIRAIMVLVLQSKASSQEVEPADVAPSAAPDPGQSPQPDKGPKVTPSPTPTRTASPSATATPVASPLPGGGLEGDIDTGAPIVPKPVLTLEPAR